MEYFKINSLWKRNGWYFDQDKKNSPDYQAGRQSFIIGDYAEPEFGNIIKWRVDEKVDGTNIRIHYKCACPDAIGSVEFKGRTDNAQIPPHLLKHLQDTFTLEKFYVAFPEAKEVILYGEGYGPKIQSCGGNYRKDVSFTLFDVWVSGWWLMRLSVREISQRLGIDLVPELGIMTESDIVEFVKSKPLSLCSQIPQMMEGIVARAEPLVCFRNGKPVVWKLKCKEFT